MSNNSATIAKIYTNNCFVQAHMGSFSPDFPMIKPRSSGPVAQDGLVFHHYHDVTMTFSANHTLHWRKKKEAFDSVSSIA